MSVVNEDIEPLSFIFEDDGLVPNNPMPFLVYKGAIDVDNEHPEKTIEGLFGANGWGEMWRNGVYDYLHYHATVHEALGVVLDHALDERDLEFERGVAGARRHRASVPVREPGFLRDRGLSARTQNACHTADA
jgi:hypothetical protein